MFEVLSDEMSESFQIDWKNRIRVFQHSETVLPSWRIRFHCVATNIEFCENNLNLVGKSAPFRYYREEQSYWIFEDIEGKTVSVKMSLDFGEVDLYCSDSELFDNALRLLCQAYKYRALIENGMLLHSSVVIYKGSGIMFFGHSGAGKSTQAELWKKYRQSDILNYDQNFVYLNDKTYMVSSTPWGGKEEYYVYKTVPLKCIVFIQKWPNENRVDMLNKANAFSALYLHNYVFPFENRIEDIYFNSITNLVTKIPVYKLSCPCGESSVNALYNKLFE